MTPTQFAARWRSATASVLLLLALAHQLAFSKPAQKSTDTPSQAPLVIRVGAIYYDDSDKEYDEINAILSALEKRAQSLTEEFARPVTFKLAVGTYDEIVNWYESDQLDLAIMNPGPMAAVMGKYRDELANIFVGIRGRIPETTSLAAKDDAGKDVTTARSMYNSVMLVNRMVLAKEFPANSKPTENELYDLVIRKARQQQTHFLFVQPLSTSGYIYPRQVLQDEKIDLEPSDYKLTYSHDVSATNVNDFAYDDHGRMNVAFVSDETRNIRNNANLLPIRGGRMKTKIVQDAVLLTPDFIQRQPEAARSLKRLLLADTGSQTFNLTAPNADWFKKYDEVAEWIEHLGGYRALLSNTLTIDQIITRINNYNRHHPNDRARVALVLSGGGAKCAYQLGAVEAIEDKLAAAQANSSQKLGIDMVIGTSGGAINALITAAEVTKDPNKRGNLASTWKSFRQSEILKPSNSVRRLLGLALGLILSLCVLSVVYTYRLIEWARASYTREKPAKERSSRLAMWFRKVRSPLSRFSRFDRLTWPERVGSILLVLALLFYLIGQIRISLASRASAEWLLRHHVFVHITEYSRQTLRWAALALFIFGVSLCVDSWLSIRRQNHTTRAIRPILLMATILLSVILPVFALYRIFLSEKSLFVSEGIVDKMSDEMPGLLGIKDDSHSLSKLSRDIIDGDVIKRDLVITGSMLQQPRNSASVQTVDDQQSNNDDSDLYFIYKAGLNPELPQKVLKDKRFVSLRDPDNASILLDAVIGSGAIFPAFEPRPLTAVKRVDKNTTRDVSIIDGGFVHNSPIEAAVKLDATHIIVIEASPLIRPKQEVNLLTNSIAAFNHLFTQAQLLDARSRREAEVYNLQPLATEGTPFLCTLDFGENFISRAIQWGDTDARDGKHPRFVRQPRPAGLGEAHR